MNYNLAKQKNIIDMAYGFSAMGRVFEKGSRRKILDLLSEAFEKLGTIKAEVGYRTIHDSFCIQFLKTIKTSKGAKRPSYGQAAKVFDVAVKVYVHYCGYPTAKKAEKLSRMLYGAIDTQILKHLKSEHPDHHIIAATISGINEPAYRDLQKLIAHESSRANMSRVEWDDVIWAKLNRVS